LQQPPPNNILSIDDHDSVDALDRNSFLDLNRAGAFDECSTRRSRPRRLLYRSAIINKAAATSRARASSRACAAAAAVAAVAA
jgi:hypothetical protein